MIKLKDIPYHVDFYWKGKRYKQFMRPKHPKGKYSVVCYLSSDPCSPCIDMPSGRKVKPVIRVSL